MPKDLEEELTIDLEEDLEDAERIEEEEVFFGGPGKAPARKRKER
jgi:hypothetical protein